MTAQTNHAAYLLAAKQRPLEVREAPYPSARANDVIVQVKAVAINPVDRAKQEMGDMMFPWVKYPCILGNDIAGEVVQVGSSVTRFKAGDRVLGHALGLTEASNNPAEGAFQNYVVLLEHMTTPIPASLSFTQASVLPLATSTAACALYQEDQLNLTLPTTPRTPRTQVLLIWGGATSVGCAAIQLAVASGYIVYATSSPHNFPLLRKLGATQVFDYNDPNILEELRFAVGSRPIAGGLSLGRGGAETFIDLFPKCQGNRFISVANYPEPYPKPKRFVTLRIIVTFVGWQISMAWKRWRRGVGWKFIFADTLVGNGVGEAIYANFLPEALESGRMVASPEAWVVGHGLDSVQEAFEILWQGVSARKVVVTL